MNGIWLDTEKLKAGETLEEYLKHGTLSLGFIGLAETLKCLIGKHHGEDAEADKLGEAIISFLRAKLDKATEKSQLNYSLLATPAEGLSGKFTKKDRKEYGIIEGVTDKDWYTNSFHVPVEYPISLFEKIKIEGKYHKYCNAGHISYVELASPPKDNLEAYYNILMHMAKNDMGYVALNFPVDRCRQCNTQGVIDGDCHVCGSSDISRIRRITGYLAELNLFNDAKKQEVANRVKHL
jgi:ribonucleoside-triphosphate reductase